MFTAPPYADIVLNSLAWLREKERMYLYAYVLMPSHLHIIAQPRARSIGELLQNFGSFTAHAILKQLRAEKRTQLLEFFHHARRDKRHQHSIWQDIQAKNIYSCGYLRQKLAYIHANPVQGNWQLATRPEMYRYSSACFYEETGDPLISVDDVRQYL
ncbi:MAG: hypothetical protein GY803_31110 [Chloroflexi bacterium]|nr:hypothetical protein [Chloroflexota bacterium]